MTPMPRTKVLVQLRILVAEKNRWTRAASLEHLRLGELVRFAVRNFVKEVETRHLLAREPTPSRPSAA
jgi:hypothetical protein